MMSSGLSGIDLSSRKYRFDSAQRPGPLRFGNGGQITMIGKHSKRSDAENVGNEHERIMLIKHVSRKL